METLQNLMDTLPLAPHSLLFNPLAWIAVFVIVEAFRGYFKSKNRKQRRVAADNMMYSFSARDWSLPSKRR